MTENQHSIERGREGESHLQRTVIKYVSFLDFHVSLILNECLEFSFLTLFMGAKGLETWVQNHIGGEFPSKPFYNFFSIFIKCIFTII